MQVGDRRKVRQGMKKTSSDRRKIHPRGREFCYGYVGEIGGDKKPLTRGVKTLLCEDGARPLRLRMRGVRDRGCDGLRGRGRVGFGEAELGGSLMGAKRDLRWVADATHRRSSGRPTVGFCDDLPWVVFGALGRRSSGGGVCTQRKGRNFFGAWSWFFLRFLAGFFFGRELGEKN